jgi:hypothetical protein
VTTIRPVASVAIMPVRPLSATRVRNDAMCVWMRWEVREFGGLGEGVGTREERLAVVVDGIDLELLW